MFWHAILFFFLFCFDVLHSSNLHIMATEWRCFSDLREQDGTMVISISSQEGWHTHVGAPSWWRLYLQMYTASFDSFIHYFFSSYLFSFNFFEMEWQCLISKRTRWYNGHVHIIQDRQLAHSCSCPRLSLQMYTASDLAVVLLYCSRPHH